MTGYTTPDNLPYPDDYNEPADVPAVMEDAASATQTALDLRPTQTAADSRYLNATGDTVTGDLVASAETQGGFRANSTGLNFRGFYLQRGGTNRWSLILDDTAADPLRIFYYDDAGQYRGTALNGDRDTGLLTVKGAPTEPLGIANKGWVDGRTVQAGTTNSHTLGPYEAGKWTENHGLGYDPGLMTVNIVYDGGNTSVVASVQTWSATTITWNARSIVNSTEQFRGVWTAFPDTITSVNL